MTILPTLSVITPSFNSGDFIEDAILSVSRQQGVSAEHIVIDSASVDNTIELLQGHPDVQWSSKKISGNPTR